MIKEIRFPVKGMRCRSCSELIEMKLSKISGIRTVKVGLPEEEAAVAYDTDAINEEAIYAEIRKMGYTPGSANELGTGDKATYVGARAGRAAAVAAVAAGDVRRFDLLSFLMVMVLAVSIINAMWLSNINSAVGTGNQARNAGDGGSNNLVKVEPQPSQPSPDPVQPSQPSQPAKVGVSADDDEVRGSPDAPVTIIEFSDFQCPFCERFFSQTYPSLVKNYIDTGKVRFIYRDFPLNFHPNAQKAAEAAECAGEQGKFWEMHDRIFNNQGAITVPDLKTYAKDIAGLDTSKFNECLDSGLMAPEVQKDLKDGSSAGVTGTPTFFVNGVKIVGAQPFGAFEELIKKELGN